MTSRLCLYGLSLTLSALSSAAAPVVTVPLAVPEVCVMGRTAVEENGSRLLAFPGTEMVVRFQAEAIHLRGLGLSGENWFNVTLNGEARPVLGVPSGPFESLLAEGLDPTATHTLRLVRRNEAWQGQVRLEAFLLFGADAQVLPPPPAPKRRMLVIGDSITCGQGTEFIPPDALPGNHNANAERAYPWILAKRYNAAVHFVSYGGKGLLRDWEGNTETVKAPEFFERTLPDDPESRWDHATYAPDLITVALGTNDFSRGLLSVETYAAAYVAFVQQLRTAHPEAKILLVSSPMLEVTAAEGEVAKGNALEAALTETVRRLKGAGVTDVESAFVGHYPGTAWDAHPIAPQHEQIAADLFAPIEALTGWTVPARDQP